MKIKLHAGIFNDYTNRWVGKLISNAIGKLCKFTSLNSLVTAIDWFVKVKCLL